MKILVLIDDERKASGPFVVTLRLYKSLRRLYNYDIKFVVSGCEVCNEILQENGFDSILINSKITYARENIRGILKFNSASYNKKKDNLKKIIDSYLPDIIHVTVHPLSVMVFDLTKQLNIPLLIGFHSTHKNALIGLYKLAYRRVLNSNRVAALCVSNWIKQNVETLKSNGNSQIHTLYNGISLTDDLTIEVKNMKEDIEIVYVAQIRKEKGLHVFLNICEKLFLELNQSKKIKVNIYGRGFDKNYNRHVENMIESLNDKYDKLVIINQGYTNNVQGEIKKSDLMLVTSLFEDPLPTVVMEAQAIGIPVVGFNRGGIPELLNYDNDFLVKSNTEDEMVNKALNIINSKSKDVFRKKSRKIAEKYFDINITSVKFDTILNVLKLNKEQ
jgi:glycosyltransferase involved in cell wall biosynthesis